MASSSKPYLLLFSLKIFIAYSFVPSFTEAAAKHGFTVELIHIDSTKSPFYNHSKPLSPYQKVNNAVLRSFQRVNNFFPNSELALSDDTTVTDLMVSQGQYLMEYFLGDQGIRTMGMIDTGSSLIWLQCEPCEKCFLTQVPIFNPSSSTSFRNTSCDSAECDSARKGHRINCDGSTNQCLYEIKYIDGAGSKGKIVKDTIKIGRASGRKVAFPRTVFGCAHYVDGRYSHKSSGMIGLGRGPLSLILQMGYDYKGRFSYCLVPLASDYSGQLSFGQNSFAYDLETVSTSIVNKSPSNLYYLTLEGISVGDARLEYQAVTEGNIKIDNGATMTFLPQDLVYKLEAGVAGVISSKFQRVNVNNRAFSLCYSAESIEELGPPIITFHFKGADVKLDPSNTFIELDEGLVCLAILSHPRTNVYGSLAQSNFLIGFDLLSNLVSFKRKVCTT